MQDAKIFQSVISPKGDKNHYVAGIFTLYLAQSLLMIRYWANSNATRQESAW